MSLTQTESVSSHEAPTVGPESLKQGTSAITLVPKEGKFSKPVDWLNRNVFLMSLFHLIALWAVFISRTATAQLLLFCFIMVYARMFFLTGGYHRYFSHRFVCDIGGEESPCLARQFVNHLHISRPAGILV